MLISSGDYATRPRHTPAAVRRRGATARDQELAAEAGRRASGISEPWARMLAEVGLPASDGARYAPRKDNGLTALTPDDRELIAVVTGLVVSSDGVVLGLRPDLDPDPDDDPDPLVAALVEDRLDGRLLGQVTPSYLRSVGRRYTAPGVRQVDDDRLDAALAYVRHRERRRTEHAGPRSSFCIAA